MVEAGSSGGTNPTWIRRRAILAWIRRCPLERNPAWRLLPATVCAGPLLLSSAPPPSLLLDPAEEGITVAARGGGVLAASVGRADASLAIAAMTTAGLG